MRLYDEAVRREGRRRGRRTGGTAPCSSPGSRDLARLEDDLAGWDPSAAPDPTEPDTPLVEVPTIYDGPDLDAVARHWDVTAREVVDLHTAAEMVVAFCGFAPGFAYCTAPGLARPVPRLARPRTRVPAGSVALADVFTGVYPTASPGGWQLVGRTDLVLWDESREQPATLAPGTRVRFVEVPR